MSVDMKAIEEIRGAVARGWCVPANARKEMDMNLLEAITAQVAALIFSLEAGNG